MRFSRITGGGQNLNKQSFKISHLDPSPRVLIVGLDTVIVEIGINIIIDFSNSTQISLGTVSNPNLLYSYTLNKPARRGIYIVNQAIEYQGEVYIFITEDIKGEGLVYISYI